MERFHDIFGHPHEPVIHGGWRRTLHHRVVVGLYGIAETKREHCRGALDKVFRREWLSSGELRHDVGEREGEAVLVLPGWSGSQKGAQLAL